MILAEFTCMMFLKYCLISICFTNMLVQKLVLAEVAADEECPCVYLEVDEIKSCKNWEDVPIKLELKLGVEDEHGIITGKIVVGAEIIEGIEVTVAIFKETANGDELVYSAAGDLCQSLQDKDAVWAPFMAQFKTDKCPIPKGVYEVVDLKINLGAAKGLLTRDFVGTYKVVITVELAVSKFLCFTLVIEIIEENRLCSECPNPQKEKEELI